MLKNLLPNLIDLKLIVHGTGRALMIVPFLARSRILLIVILFIAQYLYFSQILPKGNPLFFQVSNLAWTLIYTMIFILIVPLDLYNKSAKEAGSLTIKFGALTQRTSWPLIVETTKAFFFTSAIGFLFFVLAFVVYMLIEMIRTQSAVELGMFFEYISLLQEYPVLNSAIAWPSRLVLCQFAFVPFVIYFNKNYIEKKTSSLKESLKLTKNLGLIIWAVIFIPISLLSLSVGDSSLFRYLFEATPYYISLPILFSVNIFLHLFFIAFLYTLYASRDQNKI